MQKHVVYVIGSIAVAAASVLTCYLRRKPRDVDDIAGHDTSDDGLVSRTASVESLASGMVQESDGTFTLQTHSNPVLRADTINLSGLRRLLKGVAGQQTILAVVEELCSLEQGGALVVVYDCKGGKDPNATMPIKSLAGGTFRDFMRLHAKTLFAHGDKGAVNPKFRAILYGFSCVDHDGPCADKWTKPVLENMAKAFGQSWDTADESLRRLLDQPADGALAILSLRGTVVGASSRIDVRSKIELTRQDSKGTGTKHNAAVNAVEWCRLKGLQGAAVVRSDSGRVTFVGIVNKRTMALQIVEE